MTDESHAQDGVSRRDLLQGLSAVGVASGLGVLSATAAAAESEKPFIECYTDPLSVAAGDEVGLHVSTIAQTYSVEVARLGAKREVVWSRQNVRGARHPVPDNASTHGCGWPVALEVPVSKAWSSGYYSVTLRDADQATSGEAFFVVRPAHPGRDTSILIQLCTNTYAAYNTYGDSSLYGGPGHTRVSFDRPYQGFREPEGFTASYSGWRNWEQPFVAWAERAGYQLDYAVNLDLEVRPEMLSQYRLVLSVGHDEYWSWPMRENLEVFIEGGGNVAFFSGNTAFWQVRSENAGHALVCWKESYNDPDHGDPVYGTEHQKLLSTMFCDRLVGLPENHLTGVSFAWGGYHRFFEQVNDGDGAYTIHRPDHWMFQNTGLKRGDLLGEKDQVVGYECDGCELVWKQGLPVPTYRDGTPASFEILGTAPAGLSVRDRSIDRVADALYGRDSGKQHPQPGYAVLGSYTRGGTVVTTGCTEWPKGLYGGDKAVDQITRNILDRLSS